MEKSSKKEHCSKCGKELQRVFSSFIIPKDKKYKNYMEKNKSNALEGIPLGDVPGDKDYIEPMEGGQDPLFTPKP